MIDSETGLLSKLRTAAPRAAAGSQFGILLGIGDDAALFRPRCGYDTVLTCDWFLEDSHFIRDTHPAEAVGWKSLARAVSDLAAIGAEPRCFLLSLALPQSLTGKWLDQFLVGLRRAARALHCPLAGGDTTRQSKVLINVTVIGEVRTNRAILRSGAKAGDLIYVSGRLGEAELGLQLLRGKRRIPGLSAALRKAALKKHLYPEPRLALGRWLAGHRLATAMMDLSDGLSTDLPRLCGASHAGARVEAMQVPVVQFPKWNRSRNLSAPDLALNGGDDYELLFTVSANKSSRIANAFQGIPLTAIGQITRGRSLLLVQPDGRSAPLRPAGWDPFLIE